MYQTAIYTGTGIFVAGLGAAYYAYSNRLELNSEQLAEIDRQHQISAREDRIFMESPPVMMRVNFEEPQQEAGDIIDIDSIEAHNLQAVQYGSRFIEQETFEHQNSHSRPLRTSEGLRASIHSINIVNGSKEGLNVAVVVVPEEEEDLGTLALRKCESATDLRQIVSRTDLKLGTTTSTSLSVGDIGSQKQRAGNSDVNNLRPLRFHNLRRRAGARIRGAILHDSLPEEDEITINDNLETSSQQIEVVPTPDSDNIYLEEADEAEMATFGSINLDEMFVSPTDSNEDFFEASANSASASSSTSTFPKSKSCSPVIYYSNPRFGERYACKDSENLTSEAIVKNSKKPLSETSADISFKAPAYDNENNIQLKSCSTTERFQIMLREKRKQLNPVRPRKSEGMFPEIRKDYSGSESDHNEHYSEPNRTETTLDEGHKDSTLFLFPPVLSESRFSDFCTTSRPSRRRKSRPPYLEGIQEVNEEDEEEEKEEAKGLTNKSEKTNLDLNSIQVYNLHMEQNYPAAALSETNDDDARLCLRRETSDATGIEINENQYGSPCEKVSQEKKSNEQVKFNEQIPVEESPMPPEQLISCHEEENHNPSTSTSLSEVLARPKTSSSAIPNVSSVVTPVGSRTWINMFLGLIPQNMGILELIYFLPFIVVFFGCLISLVIALSRIITSSFVSDVENNASPGL